MAKSQPECSYKRGSNKKKRVTAYNSANSYQIIIILISQETLFFCLSNDVFFVEIEKVEEEEIEKKDSEKLIIFLTIN